MSMSHTYRREAAPVGRRLLGAVTAAVIALAALSGTGAPAQAQDVVVSATPDARAPRVVDGRVYSIDSHGPLVAVGGSFTAVRPGAGGADQPRQWLFLYDSATGEVSETFVPQLRGPAPAPGAGLVKDQPGVEAIQFAADGQSLYVGGWFTSANGTAAERIVQLNLDGSVRSTFQGSFNNTVNDLALVGDRLIVGGRFGQANGQPAQRLVSVDPVTGATQTDFNLPATGSRNQYTAYVNELDVSDDSRWLAVSGSFRKVGTAARNQLALIDLQGRPSVANWATDAYAPNCSQSSTDAGSYIRGLAFDPASSFLVVSTTGAFIGTETQCDAATRWDLPPTQSGENVSWTWRAKTGGDTLWATEVTDSAVYVGGHQRWMNNPRPSPGGDNDGPGSVVRAGIVALDPLTGVPLSWNPGRDRGRGAEAIHATSDHLFVGHDTGLWGGAIRQRLAQLPVAGGTANPQPVDVDLPVDLFATDGATLTRRSFDGASLGAESAVSGPAVDGINWTASRGGFVQAGRVFYFGASQAFYSRPFGTDGIGAETNLSSSVGYIDTNDNLTPYDQPYGVAETTAATYSNGRIYYLKSGDSKLYQRGFSLESGIIEGSEYVASTASFADVRAMAFIGDWLYAASSDGRLYRYHAPDGRVDAVSRTLVDSGTTTDWEDARGLWATPSTGTAVPPTAPTQTCDTTTPWTASYWNNISLAGAPSVTRCEAQVDNTYGSGAPAGTGLPVDGFSASWTRTVDLTAPGAIKVDATTDDGVRAYVDGRKVIDAWVDSGAVLRTGTSQALAAGPHTVRVEYYERSGGAVARVATSVVDAPPAVPEPDNLPGETTISSPATGQVLTSTSVSTTGTAADNVGVTAVRVAVYNRGGTSATRWLQADGTWGSGYASRNAVLASPGATSTTWSLGPVALPEGSYAIDARTVDAAGFVDPDRAWAPFSISTRTVDTVKPRVAVTTPTQHQQVTTSTVRASGTATDDVAVGAVRVGVYNVAGTTETRWLQADGSWGPTLRLREATLAAPGTSSTGWTLDVALPDGRYALDVRAADTAGNAAANVWRPFAVVTVAPDTTKPTAAVTSPAKGSTVTTRTVSAGGTVSDDTAVQTVRVAVYDRANTAAPWLQADGSWGSAYASRLAEVPSAGTASSSWQLGVTLPDGLYALDVRPADRAGNLGASTWWPFVVNVPTSDATAPSATVAARTVVTPTTVAVTGSARDDRGVRRVLVAVSRAGAPASRRWLQGGGRWGQHQVFRWASLERPGGRRTTWRLGLRLPPGRYVVTVLATDRSDNVQRTPATRRVRVTR